MYNFLFKNFRYVVILGLVNLAVSIENFLFEICAGELVLIYPDFFFHHLNGFVLQNLRGHHGFFDDSCRFQNNCFWWLKWFSVNKTKYFFNEIFTSPSVSEISTASPWIICGFTIGLLIIFVGFKITAFGIWKLNHNSIYRYPLQNISHTLPLPWGTTLRMTFFPDAVLTITKLEAKLAGFAETCGFGCCISTLVDL